MVILIPYYDKILHKLWCELLTIIWHANISRSLLHIHWFWQECINNFYTLWFEASVLAKFTKWFTDDVALLPSDCKHLHQGVFQMIMTTAAMTKISMRSWNINAIIVPPTSVHNQESESEFEEPEWCMSTWMLLGMFSAKWTDLDAYSYLQYNR